MEDTNGKGLFKLANKLKKPIIALKNWNKKVFGRVDVTIKELQTRLMELEDILQTNHSGEMEEDFLVTKTELDFWENWEEIQVAQIAKKIWLQERDQNTKYFTLCLNR